MSNWIQKPPPGTLLQPGHPQIPEAGWWLGQEGMGDSLYDLSGNGHPGSLSGFAFPSTAVSGWNPGRIGRTLAYDGNDDRVDIADADIFSFTAGGGVDLPFSLSAWINMNDATHFRIVEKFGAANNVREWSFRCDGSDKLGLICFQTTGQSIGRSYNTAITGQQGEWLHVAGTYDGSSASSGIAVYLNGNRVDDTNSESLPYGGMSNTAQDVNIGWGNNRFTDGMIDDVRIYNRVLSQSEIQDIMVEPFAAFAPSYRGRIGATVPPPFDLSASPFPAVVNSTDFDLIMYNRIVGTITTSVASMGGISDNDGNISLATDKAIQWGSVSKVKWLASKVQIDRLEVASPWTFGTLAPAGDCTVSNDATVDAGGTLTLSGNLSVVGVVHVDWIADSTFTIAQIAEPGDPANEHSVMWCSNGTGVGDVGDIMLKIQHGSVVKSKTLVDFA